MMDEIKNNGQNSERPELTGRVNFRKETPKAGLNKQAIAAIGILGLVVVGFLIKGSFNGSESTAGPNKVETPVSTKVTVKKTADKTSNKKNTVRKQKKRRGPRSALYQSNRGRKKKEPLVRNYRDNYWRHIWEMEFVLYKNGETRLEDLEEVWDNAMRLKYSMNGIFEPLEDKDIVQARLQEFEHFVVRKMVVWDESSSLKHVRKEWETVREAHFGTTERSKYSTPELDEVQIKRDPPNNSDIREILTELEEFTAQSLEEMREFKEQKREIAGLKGVGLKSELRHDLDQDVSAWVSNWVGEVDEVTACTRPRPIWWFEGKGKYRLHEAGHSKNPYRVSKINWNSWRKGNTTLRTYDQGPKPFRQVLSRIDYVRGSLTGAARDLGNWYMSSLDRCIGSLEQAQKELASAREKMKELNI
jgi:hypothetical protein